MTAKKLPRNYASTNVRELRAAFRMSRRALVEALGDRGVNLHQTSLRRIEEGEQSVKIEEAIAFADVFCMDLEEFITKPLYSKRAQAALDARTYKAMLIAVQKFVSDSCARREELVQLKSELTGTPDEHSLEVQEVRTALDETKEINNVSEALLKAFDDSVLSDLLEPRGTGDGAR